LEPFCAVEMTHTVEAIVAVCMRGHGVTPIQREHDNSLSVTGSLGVERQ
jgi:hypothetical protein